MNVNSSLEDINEVTKRFKVSIPATKVSEELDTVLEGFARSAKIKGFRPGKAPKSVVTKMYAEQAKEEVVNRLISSTLGDLLKEHKLNIVGAPEINVTSFKEGEHIEYTANVSLFPNPKIEGYEQFTVELPKKEVTDKEVDHVVSALREARATTKKLDFRNTVKEGDVLDMTISVAVDGETPERPETVMIGLGKGALPKEVEAGLIGLEVGQSKEITAPVPDQVTDPNLKGKSAVYKISVNSLSEQILPELDDEFAKNCGVKVETLLELRLRIREDLEKEAKEEERNGIRAEIINQLLDTNKFLIPQTLIDEEIRYLIMRSVPREKLNFDPSKIDVSPFREQLGETAEKRVRSAVIIDQILKQEKIQADQADIDAELSKMAERAQASIEEVRRVMLDPKHKDSFVNELTRTKVLDTLANRAKVKYTKEEKEKKSAK